MRMLGQQAGIIQSRADMDLLFEIILVSIYVAFLCDINVDEMKHCEMKDRLLQEEISLAVTIIKRSNNQTIMSDASRSWLST